MVSSATASARLASHADRQHRTEEAVSCREPAGSAGSHSAPNAHRPRLPDGREDLAAGVRETPARPVPQWFLCLIGLSREAETARLQLRGHLEKQFTDAMSWGNHGSCADGKWSIDHVEPCSSFTLGIAHFDEECRCFNFQDLRPLWSKENSSKGAR